MEMNVARKCLINRGRIAALIFLLLFPSFLFAAKVEAYLEGNEFFADEPFILKISISDAKNAKPAEIPSIPGLSIDFIGTNRSVQWVNGNYWSGIVLQYRVNTSKEGKYNISNMHIIVDGNKHKIENIAFNVLPKRKVSTGQSSNTQLPFFDDEEEETSDADDLSKSIKPLTEFSAKEYLTGEPIVIKYYILTSIEDMEVKGYTQLPDTVGMIKKSIEENIDTVIINDGGKQFLKKHINTLVITTPTPGNFSVFGGKVAAAKPIKRGFFGFEKNVVITFDKTMITVVSIPEDDKPSNFSGNIGDFSVSQNLGGDILNAVKYEEIIFEVAINGTGNFFDIKAPFFTNADNIKVFVTEKSSDIKISGDKIVGNKIYRISIIPEKAGSLNLGKLSYNFYNPELKKYVDSFNKDVVINVSSNNIKNSVKDDPDNLLLKNKSLTLIIAVSILSIALFGILFTMFILYEKRKYRPIIAKNITVKKESKKKDNIPAIVENRKIYDELFAEKLKSSFAGGIQKEIIATIENTIKYIDNEKMDIHGNILTKFNNMKNEFYTARYGGGTIDYRLLKTIFDELLGILKL